MFEKILYKHIFLGGLILLTVGFLLQEYLEWRIEKEYPLPVVVERVIETPIRICVPNECYDVVGVEKIQQHSLFGKCMQYKDLEGTKVVCGEFTVTEKSK